MAQNGQLNCNDSSPDRRIRESARRKRVKNSNMRMKTKGKYENRELLLIYSKIKTTSKELLQILKNRELTVNPLPLFKSSPSTREAVMKCKVGQFP
jgi:hypothetical protein